MSSNRDHKALDKGTFGGAGRLGCPAAEYANIAPAQGPERKDMPSDDVRLRVIEVDPPGAACIGWGYGPWSVLPASLKTL